MQVIHLAQNTDGYEIVTLLANRINRTNSFHAIEKNGEQFMTGGFIINDTPDVRKLLDSVPKNEQYNFFKQFRMEPFKKFYLEDC